MTAPSSPEFVFVNGTPPVRVVIPVSVTVELTVNSTISLRTIQNYESGARMPKSRDTYTKLSEALGVDEKVLMDENAEFVLRANEQYGGRGARQAWDLVADFKVLAAGGEIEEEDMDEIMRAMQEAYWEAKKNNRKYVNKRYRKEDSSDQEYTGDHE